MGETIHSYASSKRVIETPCLTRFYDSAGRVLYVLDLAQVGVWFPPFHRWQLGRSGIFFPPICAPNGALPQLISSERLVIVCSVKFDISMKCIPMHTHIRRDVKIYNSWLRPKMLQHLSAVYSFSYISWLQLAAEYCGFSQ